jgi:putative transposase
MRGFAASRHAWNFGKEILDTEYDIARVQYRDTGEKYSFTHHRQLKKLYNKIKPAWVKDKTGSATQEAFDDLGRAISRYFDIRKGKIKINCSLEEADKKRFKRDGKKAGWPKWRSKKDYNGFRVTNIYLKFDGPYIRYNTKVGYIRMCEELRFEGKIMNATFSYDGQWFWISVQVQVARPEIQTNDKAVGIDLGIKYLATGSKPITKDGEKSIENPRAFLDYQAKIRRLQRKLDRQRRANNPDCYNSDGTFIKGKCPKNWSVQMIRTDQKIKKLQTRIKNIRRNAQHHLSTVVSQEYGIVAIEDLNVNGMLKNRKLAKHISDAGFSEIRRQLEYKTDFQGGNVEVVSQWFASSKLCSGCGEKNFNLKLGTRQWVCENCKQLNERDENAAINLEIEGLRVVNLLA